MTFDCETCEGTGYVVIGQTIGGYFAPPEPVLHECPACDGLGAVTHESDLSEDDAVLGILNDINAAEYDARAGEWA